MYYYTGAVECMKEVDKVLWRQAVLNDSRSPLPFYSHGFRASASECLEDDLGISQVDITFGNMNVYLHLIANL